MLLDLDTSVRVVAGLKLMDDEILSVLVDIKGAVVADARVPLRSHRIADVMDLAATAVDDLLVLDRRQT